MHPHKTTTNGIDIAISAARRTGTDCPIAGAADQRDWIGSSARAEAAAI
jgi:hypothetical protein